MNAKEQLKEKIQLLVKENAMLKKKLAENADEETIEEMDDEVTKEEESFEDEPLEEEESDMGKLVDVVEKLVTRIEALEADSIKKEVDDADAEEEEDVPAADVVEKEPVAEGVDDEVDKAGNTPDVVEPNDNPMEPGLGEDRNKDGSKDKLVKQESEDGEDSMDEAVEDEKPKAESEDEEGKKLEEEAEDEPEKEPEAPKVESLRKIEIKSTFKKDTLREGMKKLQLM